MDTLGIIEVLVRIAWLAGAVAFVIGLVRMNSPATARKYSTRGSSASRPSRGLAVKATPAASAGTMTWTSTAIPDLDGSAGAACGWAWR